MDPGHLVPFNAADAVKFLYNSDWLTQALLQLQKCLLLLDHLHLHVSMIKNASTYM